MYTHIIYYTFITVLKSLILTKQKTAVILGDFSTTYYLEFKFLFLFGLNVSQE